ncbi:MAG TPA: hypothetical protein VKB59_17180 [Micromonosporaceae bacterium]|nr:hypothetical protein [Micromonosporaceae bacterium]
MRRAVMAYVAIGCAVFIGGCDSATSASDGTSQAASGATPPAATVGSKSDVCGRIRVEVSSHMTELGTAIGKYVGLRTADPGSDDTEDAREAVADEIKAMAADISRLGDTATDATLKTTADQVAHAIDALGANADFVTDVKSLSDVPAAIDKLSDTAQPLTDACAS